MEQIFLESMQTFMKNKAMADSQHGFTKGRLWLTNLLSFYDRVTPLLDKGGETGVIHLYLCKVFDTILLNILPPNWKDMDLMYGPLNG